MVFLNELTISNNLYVMFLFSFQDSLCDCLTSCVMSNTVAVILRLWDAFIPTYLQTS